MAITEGPMTVRVFAIVAVVSALVMVAVTPLFRVPDEMGHLMRAWQVATGDWLPDLNGAGQAGGQIPVALRQAQRTLKGAPATWEGRRETLASAAAIRVDPDATRFEWFANIAVYPPVLHAPQALGLGLARLVSDRAVVWFYGARLANALAAVALAVLAVASAPRWWPAIAGFWFLPQVQFLVGSMSADALVIAAAGLFVVRVLAGSAGPASWLGLGAVIAGKLVYVPVMLVGLRHRAAVAWLGAAAAVNVAWFGLLRALHLQTPIRTDVAVSPVDQALGLLTAPWRAVVLVVHDWAANGGTYLESLIARFGYMDLAAPLWLILLAAGMLILGALAAPPLTGPGRRRDAGLLAALALVNALGIQLALYLTTTMVGEEIIRGVQGRYFLPLVPLVMAAVLRLRTVPAPASLAWAVIAGLALVQIATVTVLIQAEYGGGAGE